MSCTDILSYNFTETLSLPSIPVTSELNRYHTITILAVMFVVNSGMTGKFNGNGKLCGNGKVSGYGKI